MSDAASDAARLPALAARAQLGEGAALERLLRILAPPLEAHVRGLVRDDDLAADVVQDVLILICRKLGTLLEPRWIRAWAYRIATRAALRAAAHARRRESLSLDELPELAAATPEVSNLDVDQLAMLPERIASLPPAAQVVVRMHYLDSLTQAEISEALEIPIGTVKSRLAYALAALRQQFKG